MIHLRLKQEPLSPRRSPNQMLANPIDLPGSVSESKRMQFKEKQRPSSPRRRRLSQFKMIKDCVIRGSRQGLMAGGMLTKSSALPRGSPSGTRSPSEPPITHPEREKSKQELEHQNTNVQMVYITTMTLCVTFFILKTFQPFILDLSRDSSGQYPFQPSTTIWVSRIVLTLFFTVWCYLEEEEWTTNDWINSIPFAGVAICTVSNVLSIYLTIEYLGSAAYAVLKNFNLPFTAILMVLWSRRKISVVQWMCVISITLGLFIYRAEVLESSNPSLGYAFVLMGVVASSVEGILLQQTSGKLASMSFQKQSFFYHFYSFLLSTVLMIVLDYDTVFYSKYGPFTGWNYLVAVYIICIVPLVVIKHAVAGLASAVVVKLIVSATTVSSFILAIFALNEHASLVEILACLSICTALVSYQMGGDLSEQVLKFSTMTTIQKFAMDSKMVSQSRMSHKHRKNKSFIRCPDCGNTLAMHSIKTQKDRGGGGGGVFSPTMPRLSPGERTRGLGMQRDRDINLMTQGEIPVPRHDRVVSPSR